MKMSDLSSLEQYKLSQQLMEGEEPQWLGRPEAFPLLSKDYKNTLILRWIIVAIVLAGLIAAYSIWIVRSEGTLNVLLIAIMVLACAYIFVMIPFMDRFSLMKRTFFCITNERIMVFVSDRAPIMLNRAGLKFHLIRAEGGCSHIAFGAATAMKPHRLRIGTITPPSDESGNNPTGAVFYFVKNAEEATNQLL